MAEELWRDQVQRLKSKSVESANKAVDYMDGAQREYLEDLLSDKVSGITDWRKRGVKPIFENMVGKIIERSAKSYMEQPKRAVWVGDSEDENATAEYLDLLSASNFVPTTEDLDMLARLLKTAVILVQWVEETQEIICSVLSRHNCDVINDERTGKMLSLCYTAGAIGLNGGKMFHVWTDEAIYDIEEKDGVLKKVGTDVNPYGMIPAVPLHDVRPPRCRQFWPKPVWEELVCLNEGLNLFHTEVKFASRYQTFPALFSNAKLPDNAVIGPDTVTEIDSAQGDTVFLDYRSPSGVSTSLPAFADQLGAVAETIADEWGVKLKIGGSGAADSGFKLIVEEINTLETRKKRLKSAKEFERNLYPVIARVVNTHGASLPEDGQLYADFDEPSFPVNALEDWTIRKEQIALGYLAMEEAWKLDDPDLSDEDIAARKAMIAAEKGAGQATQVPQFDFTTQ